MNRRTFLATLPATTASLAMLKAPVLLPVPFEYSVPMGTGPWGGDVDWYRCEYCYEDFAEDCANHVPIRQFYVAADDERFCVCEHCVAKFMEDE